MEETKTNGNGRHAPAATTNQPDAPRPRVIDGEIRGSCPVDLRALTPVRVHTPEQVRSIVEHARVAQDAWRSVPLDERIAMMKRAAKEMLRRRDEVVALAREEIGKAEAEGIFNEALGPLDNITNWSRIVREWGTPRKVSLNPLSFPNKKARIDFVPRGVVGVIAPWNFPVAGLYRAIFPALLLGNAVVLKPSEYTPRTSAWLVERLAAELPSGVITAIQGDGSTGTALVEAGIDACVFTGSVRAGHAVRIKCAELGIPCSAEMGGKDPAIVLRDCDMDRTVAGVTHWALANAGQSCGALEVAYVDSRIADEFVRRLGDAWRKLKTGTGGEGGVYDVAPLGNQNQFDLVVSQVNDARAKGATVVCGGEPAGTGLWYQPTVLDHCTDAMSVVREETFGPVLAVVRVDGAAEAIRRANSLKYGLGVSIWSRDLERAQRLADKLEYGVVSVNNHSFTGAIPDLPWTGTRETGFGVANSPYSFTTFVRPRATVVDSNSGPELFWMPYDRSLIELGNLLADAQVGRILGAWKIPLLIRERVQTIKRFFGG